MGIGMGSQARRRVDDGSKMRLCYAVLACLPSFAQAASCSPAPTARSKGFHMGCLA